MGELVADHLGHAFALLEGDGLGIDQQQGLAEEDRAGVLHGPELEVGDRHQVELRVGIGQVEVGLEAGQGFPRRLEAEGGEWPFPGMCQTRISVPPQAGASLELAHGERQEIGGEGWRLRTPPACARRRAARVRHRGVREHGVAGRRGDGDAEACLHARLVEAGEELARVRGLELGKGVAALPRGAVESAEILAQLSGEGEPQCRDTCGNRPVEARLDGLALGVGVDLPRSVPSAVSRRAQDTRSSVA